jgi:hypothetical protein
MRDGIEKLVVNNNIVEIHYDKMGHWQKDKIYIYDCTEELPEKEADHIVSYLYEEGFIMDRRTEMTIVRGGLY